MGCMNHAKLVFPVKYEMHITNKTKYANRYS